MAAANEDAQHRRHRRCQRRAGQAEAHGEHEDIVEHHIEEAAAQRRYHRQRGVAVVADEGCDDVVAHEERSEQQEDAGVPHTECDDLTVAAHEPQQYLGAEDSRQHEGQGEHQRPEQGVGEIARRALVPLRPEDGVAGGRAKAQHRADGKDEVVDGQAEVEQGDAVGARRLRDEIGVRQNVAGCAQKAENVLADIFEILSGKAHVLLVKYHIFVVAALDILPYWVSLSQSDQRCQALHLHKCPDGCIL